MTRAIRAAGPRQSTWRCPRAHRRRRAHTLLGLVGLLLCATSSARPARPATLWQLVFVPRGEGPTLSMEWTSTRTRTGEGAETQRHVELSWLDSQSAWTRSSADVVRGVTLEDEGLFTTALLPVQPAGGSPEAGSLVTISDASGWQMRVPRPGGKSKPPRARPRIASADVARLWLPPVGDLLDGRHQAAWLFGTQTALEGFVWLDVRNVLVDERGVSLPGPGARRSVLVRTREGLRQQPWPATRRTAAVDGAVVPFVADVADACGHRPPRVFSWPAQPGEPGRSPALDAFRAVASPLSLCLTGSRTITRIEGAWLTPGGREEPLVGVLLWSPAAKGQSAPHPEAY